MFCCCTWGDRQASWYAPPEIAVVVTALGWIVLDRGTRKVNMATIMMTAKMVTIMMTAKKAITMMTAKVHIYHHDD